MTSNRHPTAASSTAQHTGNAASVPQSPACGAPSSARSGNDAACDVGVESLRGAMERASVKEGVAATPSDAADDDSSAKENVRPNSGRRKWRGKKLDQKQRRAAAEAAAGAIEDGGRGGGQPKNSADKKTKDKKPHPKNRKAVVVEISSQEAPPAAPAHSPILPPRMDDAGADGASSPSTGNGDSPPGSRNGRFKKSRHPKNRKHPHRHKLKARKGEPTNDVVYYANNEFATNAGGASVLALLGQYPHGAAGPPTAEAACYDGSHAIAGGDGGGCYYAHLPPPGVGVPPPGGGAVPTAAYHPGQHDPHACHYPPGASHPPCAAPDAQQHHQHHHGAAVVGYYVPVMMHDGVVYYDQLAGPPAEHPAYYHPASFAPYYGTAAAEPPAPHGHRAAAGRALNIDAPAFNPKEKQGK